MADWSTARKMVARVVQKFHPQRVVVFGSLARGEATPDSDIDILVVMPLGGRTRRATTVAILCELAGFDTPKDVIVVTPKEYEAGREHVGSVVFPAVHEGRVLHAA